MGVRTRNFQDIEDGNLFHLGGDDWWSAAVEDMIQLTRIEWDRVSNGSIESSSKDGHP